MQHPKAVRPETLDALFDDWPAEHYPPRPPASAPSPTAGPAPAALVDAPPTSARPHSAPPSAAQAAPIPAHAAPAADPAESATQRAAGGPAAPMPNAKRTGRYPAFMCRGALFGCGAAGDGWRPTWEAAPTQGATEVLLAGPILSMDDKDVLEIAIDLAKESGEPLGAEFEAPLREFASRLGLEPGGPALKGIAARLERLAACQARISDRGWMAQGPLISSIRTPKGGALLALDASLMAAALGRDKQFAIDSTRRRSLASPLARWMHDYLSTHAEALDVDLPYLLALCGHRGRAKDFAGDLRAAMGEIVALAPANGAGAPLVDSFQIVGAGRRSRRWKLSYVRGSGSKPAFTPGEASADTSQAERARRRANPL